MNSWRGRAAIGRRRVASAALVTAAAAAGGCSPVDLLNAVAPDRLVASGIRYGTAERQRVDIYRPPGSGTFPVAMFVYGGDWSSGDRAMYRFVGAALASAGILTTVPDYRLYPGVRYPVFLEDCALALAWTEREAVRFGGNGAAPALIGHSAGAYNVAMLTLDPRWLAAVGLDRGRVIRRTVGLAGPYDFLPFDTPMLRDLFSPAPDARDTQPIAHVDGRGPPLLLLAGDRDQTVDPANSRRLAARIRSAGGDVQAKIYHSVDHREIIAAFAGPLRFLAPSLVDSARFVRS